jgi:hypothetical protein
MKQFFNQSSSLAFKITLRIYFIDTGKFFLVQFGVTFERCDDSLNLNQF